MQGPGLVVSGEEERTEHWDGHSCASGFTSATLFLSHHSPVRWVVNLTFQVRK